MSGLQNTTIPMRPLDVERFRPVDPSSSMEESMDRIHNQIQGMMPKIFGVINSVKQDAARLFPGLAAKGAFGPGINGANPYAQAPKAKAQSGLPGYSNTRLFPGAPENAATAMPTTLGWPSGLELGGNTQQANGFRNRHLPGASFRNRDLEGADFYGSHLKNGDLSGAKLQGAQFTLADLSGANLGRANLQGADFSQSRLIGANLGFANLQNAQLKQARLDNANLKNADLRGASLEQAKLSGADLSGAKLAGADFRNADLSGARLAGADMRNIKNWEEARFHGAEYDEKTRFPAGFDPEEHGMRRRGSAQAQPRSAATPFQTQVNDGTPIAF